MTVKVLCACSYCLNNKKGACIANVIYVIRGGQCKSFVSATRGMKYEGEITCKSNGARKKKDVEVVR